MTRVLCKIAHKNTTNSYIFHYIILFSRASSHVWGKKKKKGQK